MSKILEGLDKAVDQKIQNIISQNPKGSAAEQILLGKFLGSDQGTYARNVLGKDHKGWIEHIATWLKKNQPRLEKEFNELDFSDLTSLAYDMYENYLAKQGQLEEGVKGAVGGWIAGGPVGAYVGHKGQQLLKWLSDPKNQEELGAAARRLSGKTDDVTPPAGASQVTAQATPAPAATKADKPKKPSGKSSSSSSTIIDPSTGKPFANVEKPKRTRTTEPKATKKEPKVDKPAAPSLDAEPGRTIGGGYQDPRGWKAPKDIETPDAPSKTGARIAAGTAAGGVVGGAGYNMYQGVEKAHQDALANEPVDTDTNISITTPQRGDSTDRDRQQDQPAGFISPDTQAELDAAANSTPPPEPELSPEEKAEAEAALQQYRYGDVQDVNETGAVATMPNTTMPSTKSMKTIAKDLGKKAIPVAGAAFYGPEIVDRSKKGDYVGAGLAGLGAALSMLPGKSAGLGLVPDAINMMRDTGVKTMGPNEKSPIARGIKEAGKVIGKGRYAVFNLSTGLKLSTNDLSKAVNAAQLMSRKDLDRPTLVFDTETKFPIKAYRGSEEVLLDKNKIHEGDVVKGPWNSVQTQLPFDKPVSKKASVVNIPSAPKFEIVNMYKEFVASPQFRSVFRKGNLDDDGFLSLAADYIESKLGTMKPVELYRFAEKFLQVHRATQNATKMFEDTIQNLADLNKIADINKIIAGQQLMLPNQAVYVIKPGDTLSQIALDYNRGNLPVIDTTSDEFQNQLEKNIQAKIEKDLTQANTPLPSQKYPDSGLPAGQEFTDQRNNPGNLRFYKNLNKPGYVLDKAVGVDKNGFAIFANPQDGLDAMRRQIALDTQKRGLTGRELINKYAPASDNNQPDIYIKNVFGQLGLDPDSKIDPKDIRKIQQLMVRQEHGKEGMYHYYPELNPRNTMANLSEMEILQRFLDKDKKQDKPVANPNAVPKKQPKEPGETDYSKELELDPSVPSKHPLELQRPKIDAEVQKRAKELQQQKPVKEYKSSIMKGIVTK